MNISTGTFIDSRSPNISPDGRRLAYIDNRARSSNVRTQRLEGGKPQHPTDFTNNLIFHYQWSRAGKQLALSRGTVNRDVVLISSFKQ